MEKFCPARQIAGNFVNELLPLWNLKRKSNIFEETKSFFFDSKSFFAVHQILPEEAIDRQCNSNGMRAMHRECFPMGMRWEFEQKIRKFLQNLFPQDKERAVCKYFAMQRP